MVVVYQSDGETIVTSLENETKMLAEFFEVGVGRRV